MKQLEKLMIENKPVQCERCKGKIYFIGRGKYHCRTCGHEQMDDFGKVKAFLEKNGSSSVLFISQTTGVDMEIVEKILRYGNVDIAMDSKYFLQCDKCGCSIREGKYCSTCVHEITGGIMTLLNDDIKSQMLLNKSEMEGKMHTRRLR